jgi:hypothetical protein
VLDVSGAASNERARAWAPPPVPVWIEADDRRLDAEADGYWHDRAVFHFLTTPEDRAHYKRHLLDTLKPGGAAIVATFAPDGPENVRTPAQRYSPEQLVAELGLLRTARRRTHVHTTPWGSPQAFQYSRLQRRD